MADAEATPTPEPETVEQTLYEAAGGMPFFTELVDAFYEGIVTDPVLLPLYPSADLDGARRRLTLFLVQYWGGPTTYSDERGHPRLRMRHAPFVIDPEGRDRWLAAMRSAIDVMDVDPAIDAALWGYFTNAAEAMRNAD